MSAADTSYMKEKPVLSLLLSMGIPMMLSMLINSLYNIVDGIFVARMSEDAMMAISLVYPVQNLLHSIAVGFGVGTNAVIAIFLGSQKGESASSVASQGILLNIFHGLLFMIFGILFMRPFLNMFTSNETVIVYGMQYGIIVLCFSMIHTTELSFEKIFDQPWKQLYGQYHSRSAADLRYRSFSRNGHPRCRTGHRYRADNRFMHLLADQPNTAIKSSV